MGDGSQVIIVWASAHALTYWDRHPDVLRRLCGTDLSDQKFPLCLTFLSREIPEDHSEAWQAKLESPRPQRAPSFELYGDGHFETAFFDRMPGVEHIDYYDDKGDPPTQPPGWWLKVWLSDFGSAGAG